MNNILRNIALYSKKGVYDIDFKTKVIDVAIANSITLPPENILSILNQVMIQSKATGTYYTSDIFFVFFNNQTSNAFTRICWKRGVLGTFTSGTFEDYGWKNNGSGKFDPNYNPSTFGGNYLLNNAGESAMIYYVPGNTVAMDNIISGNDTVSTYNIWYTVDGAFHRVNQSANNLNSSANLAGTGYKAKNRYSSTSVKFINGTTELTRTATSTSVENAKQILGNRGGTTPASSYLGYSFWSLGGSSTYAQEIAQRTIINDALVAFGLSAL